VPDGFEERVDFVGLDAAAEDKLRAIAPQVSRHLGKALGAFQSRLADTPSVARFLYGRERIDAAMPVQHWQALAAERFDRGFFDNAARLGLRHARIGLEPRWHLGGYSVILQSLVRSVIHDFMAEALLPRRNRLGLAVARDPQAVMEDADCLADGLAALLGGVLLELDGSLSGYLGKVREDAHADATVYRHKMMEAVRQAGAMLAAAAEGHRSELDGEIMGPEFEPISAGAARLADQVTDLLGQLEAILQSVGSLTDEMLEAGTALGSGQRQELPVILGIEQSLEEVAAGLPESGKAMLATAKCLKAVSREAASGRSALVQASAALEEIGSGDSANDDLAYRLNVLAARVAAEAVGNKGALGGVAKDLHALAQEVATTDGAARAQRDARAQKLSHARSGIERAATQMETIRTHAATGLQTAEAAGKAGKAQSDLLADIMPALGLMRDAAESQEVLAERFAAVMDRARGEADALRQMLAGFATLPEPEKPKEPEFFENAALAAGWHAL
jgi:methyl-accepting chemotaxis protein